MLDGNMFSFSTFAASSIGNSCENFSDTRIASGEVYKGSCTFGVVSTYYPSLGATDTLLH